MKKLLTAIILTAMTIFLFGCGAKPLPEQLTEETEAVETSVTTVPETEGTRAELILSTRAEPNDKIQAAMDCIKNEYIAWGDFYDFDRDGIPEIASEQGGHNTYEVNYIVYKMIDGEYKEFGDIIAHKRDEGNKFTLYRDRETDEYFYIGDDYRSSWEISIGGNDTYKYVFTDDKIIKTKIAEYYYDGTTEGEAKQSARLLINDNPELNPTYQSLDELYAGVKEYLSRFEKIEEPDISPEFSWNEEYKARTLLEEYYKEQETFLHETMPEPLESIASDGAALSVYKRDNTYSFVYSADGEAEQVWSVINSYSTFCTRHSENGADFLIVYEGIIGHGCPANVVTVIDGKICVLSEYSDSSAFPKLFYYPEGEILCNRGIGVTSGSSNVIPYYWDGVKKEFLPHALEKISVEELKALDRKNIVSDAESAVSIYRRSNGLVHVNYSDVTEIPIGTAGDKLREKTASLTFVETENGLREYNFETDACYGFFLECLSVTE